MTVSVVALLVLVVVLLLGLGGGLFWSIGSSSSGSSSSSSTGSSSVNISLTVQEILQNVTIVQKEGLIKIAATRAEIDVSISGRTSICTKYLNDTVLQASQQLVVEATKKGIDVSSYVLYVQSEVKNVNLDVLIEKCLDVNSVTILQNLTLLERDLRTDFKAEAFARDLANSCPAFGNANSKCVESWCDKSKSRIKDCRSKSESVPVLSSSNVQSCVDVHSITLKKEIDVISNGLIEYAGSLGITIVISGGSSGGSGGSSGGSGGSGGSSGGSYGSSGGSEGLSGGSGESSGGSSGESADSGDSSESGGPGSADLTATVQEILEEVTTIQTTSLSTISNTRTSINVTVTEESSSCQSYFNTRVTGSARQLVAQANKTGQDISGYMIYVQSQVQSLNLGVISTKCLNASSVTILSNLTVLENDLQTNWTSAQFASDLATTCPAFGAANDDCVDSWCQRSKQRIGDCGNKVESTTILTIANVQSCVDSNSVSLRREIDNIYSGIIRYSASLNITIVTSS